MAQPLHPYLYALKTFRSTPKVAAKMLRTVIILGFCLAVATAEMWAVGVAGKLACNGKPYKDAKIKLYDNDHCK
ncbi:unnamed protein product, partial [Mesorhabditis spiculigera]